MKIKRNMFKNKLYNKYYPIKSDGEKLEFLRQHTQDILLLINKLKHISKNEILCKIYDRDEKLKPTESFLGSPKYENIIYNRRVMSDYYEDIQNIKEKSCFLGSLEYMILNNEYNNISIDEINYVLHLANIEKRKMILCLLGLVVIVFLLVILFVFL